MLKCVLSCRSLGVESVLYIMLSLTKDSTEKQMQLVVLLPQKLVEGALAV